MEKLTLSKIQVSSLSESDRFKTRYVSETQTLDDLISKFGVLNPIWVSGGEVLSGFRRLEAVKRLGLDSVPVLEFPAMSDSEKWMAAILSNMNTVIEDLDLVWIVKKSLNDFGLSDEEVRAHVLPLLGARNDLGVYKKLKLISKFEDSIIQAIVEGVIPFRGSEGLEGFSPEEQHYLLVYVRRHLKLSSNQWINVCEWIQDIMKSSGLALQDLLQKNRFSEVLDQKTENLNIQTDRWLRVLREMRFPEISKIRNQFKEKAELISSSEKCLKIEVSETFEDEGFSIRAKLKNQAELERVLNELNLKKSALSALFDII